MVALESYVQTSEPVFFPFGKMTLMITTLQSRVRINNSRVSNS